jgi:ATP adenylyltransferase
VQQPPARASESGGPDASSSSPPPPPPPPPPKNNPFENPDPALLVATLGGEAGGDDASSETETTAPPLSTRYNLVLNKFAIVPEHFILSTAEFAPQTHVLEQDDLAATYACIRAYSAQDAFSSSSSSSSEERCGELFAFFNSGPHSGASQPHRHIQLLPVERMRAGLPQDAAADAAADNDDGSPLTWTVLADALTSADAPPPDLAFETFHAPICPATTTPAQLHSTYLALLHAATIAVAHFHGVRPRDEHDDGHCAAVAAEPEPHPLPRPGEEARISYNLALTSRSLVVCPRLSDGAVLTSTNPHTADIDILATLQLNGTVLAGTALVKHRREWDALRADPTALARMLAGIGLPRLDEPDARDAPARH